MERNVSNTGQLSILTALFVFEFAHTIMVREGRSSNIINILKKLRKQLTQFYLSQLTIFLAKEKKHN